jgi:hypothetical protein
MGDVAVTAVQPKRGDSPKRFKYNLPPFSPRGAGNLRCPSDQPTRPRDLTIAIAVLAPIASHTPPRHDGPQELFASLLADGLVELGHDVTLSATADSLTTATLHSTVACEWSEDDAVDPKVAERVHLASVFEHAANHRGRGKWSVDAVSVTLDR